MTTISLSIICGDAGVNTLGRLLHSVIDRPDGCMVDEICIAWNGQNDQALVEQLVKYIGNDLRLSTVVGSITNFGTGGPVVRTTVDTTDGRKIPCFEHKSRFTLRILRQQWHGDFARARNEAFKLCTGDWILWADSDDVLADITSDGPDGREAINAVTKTYNLPEVSADAARAPPTITLREFLSQLPWDVNLILAPYDYTIGPDGNALIRQRMRRVLRRNVGWVWRSTSGAHELPYPGGAVEMKTAFVHSLLLRHRPGQADHERLLRNKELIDRTVPQAGQGYVDARHAFDVATMQIASGMLDEADATLRTAISLSYVEEEIYRYCIVRAHVAIARCQHGVTGLQEAFRAIGIFPGRQEAYFVAAECFYLMGQWQACVGFWQMAVGKTLGPQDIELLVGLRIKPHAQAAMAFCELGEPAKALWAVGHAPACSDPLLVQARERAEEDLRRKKAIDGVLDCIEYLISRRDQRGALHALDMASHSVGLRGITMLARYKTLAAVELLGTEISVRPDVGDEHVSPAELAFVRAQPADTTIRLLRDQITDVEKEAGAALWNVAKIDERTTAVVRRIHRSVPQHVIFYCPHAFVRWDPSTPEARGIGGSESSVVFLAEELARRGHRVTIYCPGGTGAAQIKDGVVWYGLQRWDPETLRRDDIVVACRAPWLLRNPAVRLLNVYVWHQDNGYGSEWVWNKEVYERAAGHLHVSKWAQGELLKELGTGTPGRFSEWYPPKPSPHDHILGNGVKDAWCALPDTDRNPHRAIYASDPTRGLEMLLAVWPQVLERVSDAQLDVYCDFEGPMMFIASTYGAAGVQAMRALRERLSQVPRVCYHGLIGQTALTHEMVRSGVYVYPGGPMPEGFGIALVQAAACGMAIVCPDEGALREVLPWQTRLFYNKNDTVELVESIVGYMEGGTDNDDLRRDARAEAARRHTWSQVAERFEQIAGIGQESHK